VLHARTADQQYSPPCQWDAVAQLVAALPDSMPVIGNGDVYEAADAILIMRQTGCKGGVLISDEHTWSDKCCRGCLQACSLIAILALRFQPSQLWWLQQCTWCRLVLPVLDDKQGWQQNGQC